MSRRTPQVGEEVLVLSRDEVGVVRGGGPGGWYSVQITSRYSDKAGDTVRVQSRDLVRT